jgi:hypothetical protein
MKRTLLAIAGVILTAALVFRPQDALSHGAVTTTVLFEREIVRILNNRCVMCHTDGGIAFPLSTYEQTWLRRGSIRTEVLRRHMPPWPAVAGYGRFANDNSLTLRETQFIVSWVEGLGPRNAGSVFLNVSDPNSPPRQEVRASAHVGHWQLGEPDLARELDATRVQAGRGDFVSRIVVDPGLRSPRRVRALEYMPGDRRVVRAASFTVQQTGQWLGSWTPWYGFTQVPGGATMSLPAGSRVVAEIHYRGASEPVVDRGTLGLFFSERPGQRRATDLVLEARRIGATAKLRASVRLASDTSVWALRPEVVPGLASVELTARRADGRTEVLLFARNPSDEWPTPFILEEPILLPRGTNVTFVVSSRDGAPRLERVRLTMSVFRSAPS